MFRFNETLYMHFVFVSSENVGYNKTAHQSGEKLNEWSIGNPASRAVDGNTDPDLEHHHHCAHPMDSAGTNAWWMVDLGQKYSINRVVIYNRKNAKSESNISIDLFDIIVIFRKYGTSLVFM